MSNDKVAEPEVDKKRSGKNIPRSYGLLVFRTVFGRDGSRELQYLIARPSQGTPAGEENSNPYYLPKGKKDEGETPQEAALREVHEETGVRAKILAPLGVVRYRSGRKEIGIYLAQYSGGNVCEDGRCLQHDWENDDVRFVNEFDAKRMLRFEFREMIDLANKLFKKK